MNYDMLYDKGEQLYHDHKYNEALEYFNLAYKSTETNDCKNYIGCCHLALGNYIEAEKIFYEIISKTSWERPVFNIGRIYMSKNDFKTANQYFNKAIKINPNSSDAHFYLGCLYMKQNDYKEAIQEFETSIKIDDCQEEVYLNLTVCLKRLKKYSEALKYAQQAYECNSSDIDIRYNLAYLLLVHKRYSEALSHFNYIKDYRNDVDIEEKYLYCLSKIDESSGHY